ncbi:hypothetical protein I6E75_13305 [Prevotella copri]|uniref:right-handed parallel beta-helix repeat-containing protein n=1 Tax=Segatella copri TaxID=165179 RepID=UPI001F261EA4|nr:right-handed parallel beta-helix repeat-containing protein [Segatella copri]MCF2611199.1 hypothetical protein [Segatella copri]
MKKKLTQLRRLVTMFLLVTAMVMPSVAWAWTQPNGKGTEADPYQISDSDELYWFAEHVNTGNTTACAELTQDIEVYREWTPIGSAPYTGTFDGQGHTIIGLRFSSDEPDSGPFGFFRGTGTNSVIRNVGIENSSFNGWMDVGGVCGINDGTIENCYFTGTVSGRQRVGGVCGSNNGTIKNCYNNGSVSCCSRGDIDMYGGVCGMNYDSGTIENCYNTGTVSGFDMSGGVCGANSGTINNCYNTGTVSGNSYVGGVCGQTSETITNCYYLSGTATGGIGSTDVTGSAEAKTATQFASGEVCYLLNGSRSEGTAENPLAWYQNISPSSRDLYPVLTGTGTNTIYQVKIFCGGTDDVGKAYSNTNKDITVEHILIGPAVFNSGKKIYSKICQREGCGKAFYYADAAGTIKATPNAEETAFAVASYTLADATAYNNQAVFTVTSLAYKRKFYDDKWMAVYVPFAIDCSQLVSDYEMATINNFHEYEQEDGTYKVVLEVKRVTQGGTIPALTPCLMRMKTAPAEEVEKTLTFENAEFSAAADKSIDCSSVTRYYQFFGTLNGKTGLTAATDFVLNAGKLYNTSESTVLLPQRWYLSATDRTSTPVETAAMLRSISIKVIGDGEATGIEDIHVNTELGADASGSTGIYDLQGRKINSEPTKGMYIKNGKKYIK